MGKAMSNPDLVKMYAQTLDLQIETGQSKLNMLEKSPDLKLGQSKEEIQQELSNNKMLKDLYQKDPEAFTGIPDLAGIVRQVKVILCNLFQGIKLYFLDGCTHIGKYIIDLFKSK